MSDVDCRKAKVGAACLGLILGSVPLLANAETASDSGTRAITGGGQAITGSGRAITGSGRAITGSGQAITGSGRAITGSGRAITGSGQAITGSGRAITGSGRAITGSGRAITGSGRAITGSGRAITGSGRAITGSGRSNTEGAQLLIVGRVSYVGSDFISVLGQTVFVDGGAQVSIREGSTVAVYGSIDFDTGGIIGASLEDAAKAGFSPGTSYLTGFVDSVDYSKGMAMVSGMAVDYNAWLSSGSAPSVGDIVSITGRDYDGINVLIADPSMELGSN